MTDSQSEQQTRCIKIAFLFHSIQQIIHRLFLPAFAGQYSFTMLMQPKDIGGTFNEARLDKLSNALFTQSINIKRFHNSCPVS